MFVFVNVCWNWKCFINFKSKPDRLSYFKSKLDWWISYFKIKSYILASWTPTWWISQLPIHKVSNRLISSSEPVPSQERSEKSWSVKHHRWKRVQDIRVRFVEQRAVVVVAEKVQQRPEDVASLDQKKADLDQWFFLHFIETYNNWDESLFLTVSVLTRCRK